MRLKRKLFLSKIAHLFGKQHKISKASLALYGAIFFARSY